MRMAQGVTIWTESGGGGKTEISKNSGDSLERGDERVVVIDGDRQRGSITDAVGMTEYLSNNRKNVLDAIFDADKTLNDVILSKDDHDALPFDLIPGTFAWNNFATRAENADIANKWMILRNAIAHAGLPERYDVIIIDAEGGTDLRQKNMIVATQNVIVPVLTNRKGMGNIARARDYVLNNIQPAMQRAQIDLDFGILAVIPNRLKQSKSIHKETATQMHTSDFPTVPFNFYTRGPADDAYDRQQTIFQFFDDDATRDPYDYEDAILDRYHEIANVILAGDVSAAQNPEPTKTAGLPESRDSEGDTETEVVDA